ncbi:MAG: hypothetical protein ACRDD1_05305 [Planctomycetia bacterium]
MLNELRPHGTTPAGPNPLPTYPAPTPKRQLDYVVFRAAEPSVVRRLEVLPQPDASDHRPILAEFTGTSGPKEDELSGWIAEE